VDGASIPQFLWSFIGGPFDGNYAYGSVIHDYYCRVRQRTAHDTHRNFYYGMRAKDVAEWKAVAMHWAVSAYGPDWKIEKREVSEHRCKRSGEIEYCETVFVQKDQVVPVPPVDLENPEVRAIAISKFAAVAKTLRTSSGETLDVGPKGQVSATPENIEANAEQIREALSNKTYKTNPADLGVMSDLTFKSLNDVQPWPSTEILT
jgi:hypothetical protein